MMPVQDEEDDHHVPGGGTAADQARSTTTAIGRININCLIDHQKGAQENSINNHQLHHHHIPSSTSTIHPPSANLTKSISASHLASPSAHSYHHQSSTSSPTTTAAHLLNRNSFATFETSHYQQPGNTPNVSKWNLSANNNSNNASNHAHQQQQQHKKSTHTIHQSEFIEREQWGKKMDFLLSVIGFAVDLSNGKVMGIVKRRRKRRK